MTTNLTNYKLTINKLICSQTCVTLFENYAPYMVYNLFAYNIFVCFFPIRSFSILKHETSDL